MTIAKCVVIDEDIGATVSLIEQEQVAAAGRVTAVEEELVIVKAGAEDSRITDLEQEQDTLASAASALTDRVGATEDDIAALEQQDTSLASTIADLSARVTMAENAIDAVNTSLALAIQRIDTLESQDLESRVDALEENDSIGVADRVYLVSNATNRMMYATTSTANANSAVTNEYTSWKMYKETSDAQDAVTPTMMT